MTKLSRFFNNIYRSFTSASFYQDVLKAPFGFSLKYYLLLLFLVSLIFSVKITSLVYPVLNKVLQTGPVKISEAFPKDLKLEIKNGEATLSGKIPFVIPISILDKDAQKDFSEYLNLFVIDTRSSFSEELYKNYKSLFLLTKTSLVYPDSRNPKTSYTITPLTDVGNVTVNKQSVETVIVKAMPSIKIIMQVGIILLLPFVFGFFISAKLFQLFFLAIVIYIFAKIAKYNFGLKKSYQLGIHASTLPLLIETGAFVVGFPIFIPFWYSLLSLIILFNFLRKIPLAKV